MQFANNENGVRVHIGDAEKEENYFCPYCNAPLIQCRGRVKIPYFSHKKGHLCSDTWNYDQMSEWHLNWQEQYPRENREVSITNTFGRHRADVLINGTVIEFQHSPISVEEFNARNEFYTACGYRVTWLFDEREHYRKTLTEYNATCYRWKYPRKTLLDFDIYGKVQVFFQLLGEEHQDECKVIRLTDFSGGNLNYFGSAPSEHYTKAQFVELTITGRVKRATDVSGKNELCDQLYTLMRTTGERAVCGCPISHDGYAPLIRDENRIICDDCPFCVNKNTEKGTVMCAGRFREHIDCIETVLKFYHQQLTYIDKDGVIQKTIIEDVDSPVKSIIALAKEYNAQEMIVRNVYRNKKFWIKGNALEMSAKYHGNIYGKFFRDYTGKFDYESRVIYEPWERAWIVEWFKRM